ncbi:protein DpdG [Gordonia sp. CPCC 205515]|uniref:protein DpdG n=1 Tax=Gordonia sp. CPCC 205515 TaxID=3140791 RepID=UPI003AF3BA5A
MTIINAVGSLPGLGRLLVNHVISAGNTIDRTELAARLLPKDLRTGDNPTASLDTTLTAIRDSGLLAVSGDAVSTTPIVDEFTRGKQVTPQQFRRLFQKSIFDPSNEDPWKHGTGDTLTAGAKDLNRALSWFLAQDCMSVVTWDTNSTGVYSAQALQIDQLPDAETLRPFSNDVRWNTFARWSVAIGMAEPALRGNGLHPNATVAIRDVTREMSPTVHRVDDYLAELARRLPVLSGGTMRRGFLQHTDSDPDPHVSTAALDTTVGQALLALEEEDLLVLKSEADTGRRTINMGATPRSVTHVEILGGGR